MPALVHHGEPLIHCMPLLDVCTLPAFATPAADWGKRNGTLLLATRAADGMITAKKLNTSVSARA
eukprot:13145752-Alexandrium_andersonii.AAC.1